MIIALAGRRIDALSATTARFPLERCAAVRERISAVLLEQQATALASSAACGADLLALDVAGQLGLRRRIILPFEPARFRASSVIDRPGEWGSLFDQIIREVKEVGDLVVLHEEQEDEAIFLRANRVILDEAQKLVPQVPPERASSHPLHAVIVWEGKPRGEGDITADFANEAHARSIPVTEILTQ
jgi:hypothetical protein